MKNFEYIITGKTDLTSLDIAVRLFRVDKKNGKIYYPEFESTIITKGNVEVKNLRWVEMPGTGSIAPTMFFVSHFFFELWGKVKFVFDNKEQFLKFE